jgi:DNA-directed RNA polymerase subunit RPC12/RpoP
MSNYVKLKCGKCGSPYFKIPENAEPDDPVQCQSCGARVLIYLLDGFESVPHPVLAAGIGHGLARPPAAAKRAPLGGGNGGARVAHSPER